MISAKWCTGTILIGLYRDVIVNTIFLNIIHYSTRVPAKLRQGFSDPPGSIYHKSFPFKGTVKAWQWTSQREEWSSWRNHMNALSKCQTKPWLDYELYDVRDNDSNLSSNVPLRCKIRKIGDFSHPSNMSECDEFSLNPRSQPLAIELYNSLAIHSF